MAIELPTQAHTPKPWGVQVARSRKLQPAFEENSTWAYTPGTTFHQPEYFARTTLPGATTVVAEAVAPRPADHTADLLLVPPVKQVTLLRRLPIPVREPLPVAVQGEGAEQARTILEQELQRRTGLTLQAVAATDGATVLLAVDPTLEQALRLYEEGQPSEEASGLDINVWLDIGEQIAKALDRAKDEHKGAME